MLQEVKYPQPIATIVPLLVYNYDVNSLKLWGNRNCLSGQIDQVLHTDVDWMMPDYGH